ncbi:MAG: metallophosphoesterase [Gammaproteobacteria bacterium]|nr:metallophosphoesterase [Gammaproteobacteria bacterium]
MIKSVKIFDLTDTEGTKNFFEAIQKSSVLGYYPKDGLSFHRIPERAHFIFNGDLLDRGKFGFDHLRLLTQFKLNYPDQVTLIAGNRDINKIRLSTELDKSQIRERLLHCESPRWVSHQTRPLDTVAGQDINALTDEECQLIYLKWMLKDTMGSPHAFRYMREALEAENPQKTITDKDILNRFLQETSPDGPMGEYLSLTQLIEVIPGTSVLTLHGGLMPTNIGRTPDMKADEPMIENIYEWAHRYNQWYQQQIQLWREKKTPFSLQPASTPLDTISLPLIPRSIVVGNMLDDHGRFNSPSIEIEKYLIRNKISLVLTGHNPYGDHPAILRGHNNVLFVSNDTCYADAHFTDPDDTRGGALHTTEIIADEQLTKIFIQARLSDETETQTELTITPEGIIGDPYIGKVLADHRLVQCRLASGDYRLIEKSGKNMHYSTITANQLEQELTKSALNAKM